MANEQGEEVLILGDNTSSQPATLITIPIQTQSHQENRWQYSSLLHESPLQDSQLQVQVSLGEVNFQEFSHNHEVNFQGISQNYEHLMNNIHEGSHHHEHLQHEEGLFEGASFLNSLGQEHLEQDFQGVSQHDEVFQGQVLHEQKQHVDTLQLQHVNNVELQSLEKNQEQELHSLDKQPQPQEHIEQGTSNGNTIANNNIINGDTTIQSVKKQRKRKRKNHQEEISQQSLLYPSARTNRGRTYKEKFMEDIIGKKKHENGEENQEEDYYFYEDDEEESNEEGGRKKVRARSNSMSITRKMIAREAMIAQAVGFPADSLTEEEIEAGVVDAVGGPEQVNYIIVRNHILALWRENVGVWLHKEKAMESIRSHHSPLVDVAYEFMIRHGYINFGVSPSIKANMFLSDFKDSRVSVLIIGAGLAGLAAARQLRAFGLKVAIVEARKRPGGRVLTKRMGNIEHGVNAAADLGGSVITGIHGNPVGVLARQLGFPLHKIRDTCPLYQPDGRAVDVDMDNRVESCFNKVLERACQLRQAMDVVGVDVSLGTALETFRRVHGVAQLPAERRLWDWHLANLEYANAGLLSEVSLAFWDQDDPYEMGGDHCFVAGGNVRFVEALAEDMPIFYNRPVSLVRYGSNGIQVVAGGQVFQADMALCTVPLGVLKAGTIRFEPELPQRKLEAIQRLGFGLLNKVAMLFETAFWEPDIDTFGHLCEESSRRGEFFLFYSYGAVSGGPLLMALVAGEAALEFESMDPPQAVDRVLQVLRGIYSPRGVIVPDPLETVCTRWGSEPFTLGSYSHVAVGSSGDDYDILAESVGGGRLFFAGEATNRRYPATMHGAFLSGMREASNILKASKNRDVLQVSDKLCYVEPSKILIEELFREPDLFFGRFSVLFDPRSTSPESMVLLRVLVGSNAMMNKDRNNSEPTSCVPSKQLLQLFCMLSRQQAVQLSELCGGDGERLRYLWKDWGVKVVGRNSIGPQGKELVSAIENARLSQKNAPSSSLPYENKDIIPYF